MKMSKPALAGLLIALGGGALAQQPADDKDQQEIMQRMHERMQTMQKEMDSMRASKDPQERHRMMREHHKHMREQMRDMCHADMMMGMDPDTDNCKDMRGMQHKK